MVQVSATPNSHRVKSVPIRSALDAIALFLLIAPVAWLGVHWLKVPETPLHLRGSRWPLLIFPTFSLLTYVLLGKLGWIKTSSRVWTGRLSSQKPLFRLYFLTLRVEALAFFAVLSFGMDRAAITGLWMPIKHFALIALSCVVVTIIGFTVKLVRSAYESTLKDQGVQRGRVSDIQ